MARTLFGGSSDDYAVDTNGRPLPNRRIRFYTSAAMTTEITDIASDLAGTGTPLVVSTNGYGFWGPVYLPDGTDGSDAHPVYAGAADGAGNPPKLVVRIYSHTAVTGGVSTFMTRTGDITLLKADVTSTGLAAADVGADATGAAATVQTNLTAEVTRAQAAEAALGGGMQFRTAVAVATANQASLTGLPTVDGVTLTAGQVILLTAQSTGSQNGLWAVAVGAWTRPSNFAVGSNATATSVLVESGTAGAGTTYAVTGTTNNVVGTNVLTFVKTSGSAASSLVNTADAPGLGLFFPEAHGGVADSNGTTGNGTDNGTAIDAAIAACQAAGGGTVYFSRGTYRTSHRVHTVTASNVQLRGQGQGATRIFIDNATASDTTNTYDGIFFDGGATVGTINNVSLRDLTLYRKPGGSIGAFPAGWSGEMSNISLRGVTGFTIDNVETYNSELSGIITIRSTDGTISRCRIHDLFGAGVQVMHGSQRITITNNHVHDILDDGIAVGADQSGTGTNGDIVISGNTIHNPGSRGVSVMFPCHGATVTGNTISYTKLSGIMVGDNVGGGTYGVNPLDNIVVEGNTIIDAGSNPTGNGSGLAAGIVVNPSNAVSAAVNIDNVVIANNVIKNPVNGFIWVLAGSNGAAGCSRLRIQGNVCRTIASTSGTTRYPGILVRGTNTADVVNNTIDSPYHEAVLADSGNSGIIRVSANTILAANQAAAGSTYDIAVSSGQPVVQDNVSTSTATAGITSLVSALLNTNNVSSTANTYAADTFTRADGALGTSSGGQVWTNGTSTHTIQSNSAKPSAYSAGVTFQSWLDTTHNGKTSALRFTASPTTNRCNVGMFDLYVDSTHHILLNAGHNAGGSYVTLFVNSGSGLVQRGTQTGISLAAGSSHTLSGIYNATTNVYTVQYDGATQFTYTLTAGEITAVGAGTKVGLRTYTDTSEDDGGSAYTNLLVTA